MSSVVETDAGDDASAPGAPGTPGTPGAGAAPRRIELSIWQLAWPTAASMIMASSVQMIDFLMIGSLGGTALAAMGMGMQVHFLQFGVFAAVSMGTVALVARAVGAGDLPEAERLLQVSVVVTAVLGCLCMLAIPMAEPLIGLFGVEDEVRRGAAVYLRIMLMASIPMGMGLIFFSALRGAGDVIRPLWVGLFMNLLNVLGNYMLIFGHWGAPRLGVAGAAYATALSMAAGMLMTMVLWRSGWLIIKPGRLGEGVSWDRARRLLRVGIPSAMESAVFDVGLLVFTAYIAEFGTAAISAYFIGTRVLMFSFVPGVAYQMAASTLVGQNLGAGQPQEARRAGWRALRSALVAMSITGLTLALLARPITSMFGATGAQTVELSVAFIYILAAAQPMMAFDFALGGALRGAGDTRFPLLAVFTGLAGVRLGLVWVAMTFFDVSITTVWSFLLLDYTTRAVMLAARYRGDRWQHIEV